eukprot:g5064.t1
MRRRRLPAADGDEFQDGGDEFQDGGDEFQDGGNVFQDDGDDSDDGERGSAYTYSKTPREESTTLCRSCCGCRFTCLDLSFTVMGLFLFSVVAHVLLNAPERPSEAMGRAYLAANAKMKGVIVLRSGLQYRVLEQGPSPCVSPSENSKVEVHYKGMLIDGTVFDSSHERQHPSRFGVTQVIKGWTEALQLMCEGDLWKLWIPPELAYREQYRGQYITPNATLVFKVRLMTVLDFEIVRR